MISNYINIGLILYCVILSPASGAVEESEYIINYKESDGIFSSITELNIELVDSAFEDVDNNNKLTAFIWRSQHSDTVNILNDNIGKLNDFIKSVYSDVDFKKNDPEEGLSFLFKSVLKQFSKVPYCLVLFADQRQTDEARRFIKDRIAGDLFSVIEEYIQPIKVSLTKREWSVRGTYITIDGAIVSIVYKGSLTPFFLKSKETILNLPIGTVPEIGYIPSIWNMDAAMSNYLIDYREKARELYRLNHEVKEEVNQAEPINSK